MKRILIIEDEPDVAETIKRYLEKEGYKADYSLNAPEAADMMKDYDLLLLDLIMPKFSGRAVLKDMKAKGVKKPIVILSAVAMPAMISEEMARDFPGIVFVAKTSMYADLLPAINNLIGK